MPDYKIAWRSFLCDPDGTLWHFPSAASERFFRQQASIARPALIAGARVRTLDLVVTSEGRAIRSILEVRSGWISLDGDLRWLRDRDMREAADQLSTMYEPARRPMDNVVDATVEFRRRAMGWKVSDELVRLAWAHLTGEARLPRVRTQA